MEELYKFDTEQGEIIGVDEAGRGPLAGPVVAAAVKINEYHDFFKEINDSKNFPKKKERYFLIK